MAANYLHGVETAEVQTGAVPIQVVKSSVIALTGIAPIGAANTPVLVLSEQDAAQFGKELPGFSIPQALRAIFDQGPATVVVVNTFSSTTNTAQVTAESKTVTNGRLKLTYAPIGTVTILDSNDQPTTFVEGEDYDLDEFGNFVVLSAEIPEATVLKFTYKRLDGATVTDAQIIGTVEVDGDRTGMQCFDLCFQMFGFNPKIIICPGYSTRAAVAAEMISKAEAPQYRGMTAIDAPAGTTPTGAIAGRGPAGTIAGFKSSSDRAVLLYPMLKAYDPAADAEANFPYSAYWAGVVARVDREEGYWVSPSNHEILGILGLERFISAVINDASSEANLLNEKGITTVFNSFGSGFRVWGNRSAAWPTVTHPRNFINIRRTADVIAESIELAMLQFIDRPINNAIIDDIKETVNQFIRTLIGRGALVDGVCTYDPAKNPPTELALGHLTFDYSIMPPPPAERITFNQTIDINLLRGIGSPTAATA